MSDVEPIGPGMGKKKKSPWKYVGIGCGVILVILIIGVIILITQGKKLVKYGMEKVKEPIVKALPADMIEPPLIEIIKSKVIKEKNEDEKAHAIKVIGTIIPLVLLHEKQALTSLLIEKMQDKSSLIRKTTLLELVKLITPSYKTKNY